MVEVGERAVHAAGPFVLVDLWYLFELSCTLFFFFQAEDGIRDLIVTGVQTCALPIFGEELDFAPHPDRVAVCRGGQVGARREMRRVAGDARARLGVVVGDAVLDPAPPDRKSVV